jgi:hypothetical protein
VIGWSSGLQQGQLASAAILTQVVGQDPAPGAGLGSLAPVHAGAVQAVARLRVLIRPFAAGPPFDAAAERSAFDGLASVGSSLLRAAAIRLKADVEQL